MEQGVMVNVKLSLQDIKATHFANVLEAYDNTKEGLIFKIIFWISIISFAVNTLGSVICFGFKYLLGMQIYFFEILLFFVSVLLLGMQVFLVEKRSMRGLAILR